MLIDILIALCVVAVIGFILGVLLAVASKLFYVPENKLAKLVRECLPGVNCGACGYKGCDDYAAAIAEGKAKPNLCVPGAEATAAELSALLNIEVEEPADVVAFVHCNGHCDATADKANYIGIKSCKAAAGLYGGPGACRFGCMGFGDCAKACPANAICIDDGIAHIDTTACLGCGLCTTICPKHLINLVPQDTKAVVMCSNQEKGADARKNCQNACIGCKKCERGCPEGAITVTNNVAKIDYTKCSGCGTCVDGCPTKCLKAVFFPDLSPERLGKKYDEKE